MFYAHRMELTAGKLCKVAKPWYLINWHAPKYINRRGPVDAVVNQLLQGQPSVSGTFAEQRAAPLGANRERSRV